MADYYRYFKGGIYRILCVAKDSETQERIVVYQTINNEGDIWARPYDLFFDKVILNGVEMDRFVQISEIEPQPIANSEFNRKYHFPDIDYSPEMPTMLYPQGGFSRGVKAMISLLRGRKVVSDSFFDSFQNDDDIENEAWRRIMSYRYGDDLADIFHLIQTWGGSSGRGIYVYGEGFNWEKLKDKYERLANDCLKIKDTSDESIDRLVQTVNVFDKSVNHLGISFITKHIRFWLYRTLGNDALPIYDSVMASEVMRKNRVSIKHLSEYWKAMVAKSHQLGICLMPLERQIFQYSLGTR